LTRPDRDAREIMLCNGAARTGTKDAAKDVTKYVTNNAQ
jgi:hypothetical protein